MAETKSGAGAEPFVVIYEAQSAEEATILRGLLQSAGIGFPAEVKADPFPVPNFTENTRATEILVRASQVEDARKILASYGETGPGAVAVGAKHFYAGSLQSGDRGWARMVEWIVFTDGNCSTGGVNAIQKSFCCRAGASLVRHFQKLGRQRQVLSRQRPFNWFFNIPCKQQRFLPIFQAEHQRVVVGCL